MNVRKIIIISLLVSIALTLAFIWSNSLQIGAKSNSESMHVTKKVQEVVDPDKTIPSTKLNKVVRKSAHIYAAGISTDAFKVFCQETTDFHCIVHHSCFSYSR